MKKLFLLNTILFVAISVFSQNIDSTGMYFSKKEYIDTDIPTFEESKNQLPQPILEDSPRFVEMYWKCWEVAFNHFKKPPEGSPFVSNILDEVFCDNIFQWDMIFMVMFARYGHDIFPANPDFVGWTGIGPIALLIENIIGLRVSAVDSTITWRITRTDKHGIQKLKIGDATVDLLCENREDIKFTY